MLKISLALGLAAATACASMQKVEPAQFIPRHNPLRVTVWTAQDRGTIVSDPQVQGDTLVGTVMQERWAVPLRDVVRVEAKTSDPTRTALFIAGAAASSVGLYLMSTAGRGSGSVPCPADFPPAYKTELCGQH